MVSDKTSASRRIVHVLAKDSAWLSSQDWQFDESTRDRLTQIALKAGMSPKKIPGLIKRSQLARLRYCSVGELPIPSEAKGQLTDLVNACGKMKQAARELSNALRSLGGLNKKLLGAPGNAALLIDTLSNLSEVCGGLADEGRAIAKPLRGRQVQRPLDYAVIDAIASAWHDAGLNVTFSNRGSSHFQNFAAESLKPVEVDRSIYRAVWEAREGKPLRVRRTSKK